MTRLLPLLFGLLLVACQSQSLEEEILQNLGATALGEIHDHEVRRDKDVVQFDDEGRLLHAELYGLEGTPREKVYKDMDWDDYLSLLRGRLIPEEYDIVREGTSLGGRREVFFYRPPVENPYDCYRLVFEEQRRRVLLFDQTHTMKVEEDPTLTKVEAIARAVSFLEERGIFAEHLDARLAVREPNTHFGITPRKRGPRLIFLVTTKDLALYVDATDGSLLGGAEGESLGKERL